MESWSGNPYLTPAVFFPSVRLSPAATSLCISVFTLLKKIGPNPNPFHLLLALTFSAFFFAPAPPAPFQQFSVADSLSFSTVASVFLIVDFLRFSTPLLLSVIPQSQFIYFFSLGEEKLKLGFVLIFPYNNNSRI